MILAMLKDFPTRDIAEFFDSDGRTIGKFIGPDALEWTYQIRLEPVIEQGNWLAKPEPDSAKPPKEWWKKTS